ncbi:MAG: trypsin-like peptidase domain-containing protein [Firmicutes bacterium]|nr:trypsin-like peptidase domain-containing protein [Bacillota bacterium]
MFKKYALTACIAFILGASVFAVGFHQGAAPTGSAAADPVLAAGPGATAAALAPDGGLYASRTGVIPLAGSVSLNQSVSSVVKAASESVVSIGVSVASQSWFGNSLASAAGSGIIFSEDADNIYIITNYHVVDGAVKATISLDDNIQAAAHYVGGDSIADIAVLSVTRADLKAAGITSYAIAKFGDSDKISVGDFAIAIGNAAGEGKSATFGIISAINKQITIDNKTLSVIQTDAAINPGNSGGALVDFNAEVIGINTAKLSDYGIEGMGYSMPINQVKTIANGIMKNKGQAAAQPGYLGISGVTITAEYRDYYGFPSTGVFVQTVYAGTGAYNAGLRRGDLITKFNGADIASVDALNAEIEKTKAGQSVSVTLYRSGANRATVLNVTMTAQSGGLSF